MKFTQIVILGFAAALFACDADGGSGGGPGDIGDPGTVMGGKATGEKTAGLTMLETGVDDTAAQGPITRLGGATQQWVGSFQSYNAQQMAGRAGLASSEHAALRSPALGLSVFDHNHRHDRSTAIARDERPS